MSSAKRVSKPRETWRTDSTNVLDRYLLAKTGQLIRDVTADLEALGRELDALRQEVLDSRGAKDAAYIRRTIAAQRYLELGSRAVLLFSIFPPAWLLGTAGLTAALCVDTLERQGVTPARGEVLVTGATGGVGSIAVALLGRLGYNVAAVTGKASEAGFLRALGATTVLSRDEFNDGASRVLLKERWAGVVDTVGDALLASAIKATRYGGSIAACGNAASPKLELTVFPFILRGVNLLGIDSANCPLEIRTSLWRRLGNDLLLRPT